MEQIYHMGIFTLLFCVGALLMPVGIGFFIIGFAIYYLFKNSISSNN